MDIALLAWIAHHLRRIEISLIGPRPTCDIPMSGPMKMPKFPAKAKKLKALACVLAVLFSVIMLRIVL